MITLIDICLPDYFNGHHKTVLQVPVYKEMTKEDLSEAILSEYNMCWDHYCEYGDWPDLTEAQLYEECKRQILTDEPFSDTDLPSIEEYENDEDMESVYAFFIWEE